MKTIKLFIPVIMFAVIFINSCGNNTLNAPNNPQGPGPVSGNYVIVTPAGGSADTLFFSDSNQCGGSYDISQNSTLIHLRDTTAGTFANARFEGNSTGSPAFLSGYVLYYGSNSLLSNSISGTVTTYDVIGGKIQGTFSGSYTGGSAAYQCSGVFTVKRTQ